MSDDDFDADNGDDDRASDGIKQLRKQHKEMSAELKRLREENETLSKSQRSRSVADLVAGKGYDRSIAKFYSEGDVTDEAVSKWLEDNSSVFVKQTQGDGGGKTQAEPSADEQAASRIGAAATDSDERSSGPNILAGDIGELQKQMDSLPYEELVKRFPQMFPQQQSPAI